METTLINEKPKASTTAKAQPLKVEESPSFFPEPVKPKNNFNTASQEGLSAQQTDVAAISRTSRPELSTAIIRPEVPFLTNEEAKTESEAISENIAGSPTPVPAAVAATNNSDAGLPVEAAVEKAEENIAPEQAGGASLVKQDTESGKAEKGETGEDDKEEEPNTKQFTNSAATVQAAVAETDGGTNTATAASETPKASEATGSKPGSDTAGESTSAGEDKQGESGTQAPESYLDTAASEAALAATLAEIGTLAKANATTKPAKKKVDESKAAVTIPMSQRQSESNAGQVETLAKNPVPQKTGEAPRNDIRQNVEKIVPKKLEDVDTFKKSNKAASISGSLMTQVRKEVGSVQNSFSNLQKPTTAAPARIGTSLPAPEPARGVKALSMTGALLPTLKKEALDTTQYTDGVKAEMAKQGITQEQLDMVDSGNLAQAKIAKGQLEADAAQLPAEAQETIDKEHKAVNTQVKNAEATTRTTMRNTRKQVQGETGTQQVKAKTDLEKRRDETAKSINAIYEGCRTRVKGKLDNLETRSVADFDRGQKLATQRFEDRVERDKEAFKDKRYGGNIVDAILLWSADLFRDLSEFPEMKAMFKNAKEAYVKDIDRLILNITNRNNAVIKACRDDLEATRKEIERKVNGLPADLIEIGRKTQGEIGRKLKELSGEIDKQKEKLEKQLVAKRAAAIKAIDKKIAEMKEKMKGGMLVLVDLLKDGAKQFFKYALELVGMDAESFFKTLQRAGEAIKAIFDDPGKFFSNLVAAVKGSIDDFAANFKKYLTEQLFVWLTGAIGSVVTLPKDWDIKGIFSVVLQLAGISWAFIRKQLVNAFGEEKVAYAEEHIKEVKEVVVKFLTDGVAGLWDWLKDQAESLKAIVVEGLKDWLLTRMVIGFAEWIVSLLIPGGGIVKLIQGIYKLIMWFVDNIQRIVVWVGSIIDSLGKIATGDVSGAIKFMVEAMKTIIPVILDFFAKLLNISGIVEAVKAIVGKIMAPIQKVIDKFIAWMSKQVNKIAKKFKGKGKSDKKADVNHEKEDKENVPSTTKEKLEDTEVGKVVRFNAGGDDHKIWIDSTGSDVEVMVASDPMEIKTRLSVWRGRLDTLPEEQKTRAKSLLGQADTAANALTKDAKTAKTELSKAKAKNATAATIKSAEKADNKVEHEEDSLKTILKELFTLFGDSSDKMSGWFMTVGHLDKYTKNEIELDEPNPNKQIVGLKGIVSDRGFIIGSAKEENKYVKSRKDAKDFETEFGILSGLGLEERRKRILTKKPHNKFEPVDIKTETQQNGGQKITYRYNEGNQKFTVFTDPAGYPVKVIGDELTLHDYGSGIIQDPNGKIKNAGMNSAHVLGNMFGGSGHKKAKNIVVTSAEYNQKVMRQREDLIKSFILNNADMVYFTLEVNIKYIEKSATFNLEKIRESLSTLTKTNDERNMVTDSELLNRIRERLKQTDHPRIKKISYDVTLYDISKEAIDNETFKISESDFLFGTK